MFYTPDMFYFAYGSNMDPLHMRRRCPGALLLGPALLRDWRLGFFYRSTSFPGGGAADIVQVPGEEVWGVLWRVSAEEMQRMDGYEDVPWGYKRQEVRVRFRGHDPLVTTYTVVQKLPRELPPVPDYRAVMLRGARLLPRYYQRRL